MLIFTVCLSASASTSRSVVRRSWRRSSVSMLPSNAILRRTAIVCSSLSDFNTTFRVPFPVMEADSRAESICEDTFLSTRFFVPHALANGTSSTAPLLDRFQSTPYTQRFGFTYLKEDGKTQGTRELYFGFQHACPFSILPSVATTTPLKCKNAMSQIYNCRQPEQANYMTPGGIFIEGNMLYYLQAFDEGIANSHPWLLERWREEGTGLVGQPMCT